MRSRIVADQTQRLHRSCATCLMAQGLLIIIGSVGVAVGSWFA